MHRSIYQAGRDRFSVLHESGGRPWTCIIETSGVKGRHGCVIIRVQGKDSRAYGMVPLRINDAFRGRSIEGPDSAQWNDIAVIIRDPSHPPIALIPRNRNTRSSFY